VLSAFRDRSDPFSSAGNCHGSCITCTGNPHGSRARKTRSCVTSCRALMVLAVELLVALLVTRRTITRAASAATGVPSAVTLVRTLALTSEFLGAREHLHI